MKRISGKARFKRFFAIVIALSLAGFLLAGCGTFKARIEAKKANELYAQGEYLQAIEGYKKVLDLDPSFDLAHLNIGYSYFNVIRMGAGDKEKEYASAAVKAFDEYLKNNPQEERKILEYQINVYTFTKQYDQAVELLKKGLEKNPKDLTTIAAIANLYSQAGRFEDSLAWNKKVAEVDSQNPEAFYTVGVMCWQKSYYSPQLPLEDRAKYIDEGIAALNKALSMKSNYYEAVTYLGLLYREKANKVEKDEKKKDELIAKAEELYKQAVELKKSIEKTATPPAGAAPAPEKVKPGEGVGQKPALESKPGQP